MQDKGPLPWGVESVDWWLHQLGYTEPLSREAIDALIDANGGTAKDLFLKWRRVVQGVDLADSNLRWVKLDGSDLQEASFLRANLQNANLPRANLRSASLDLVDLQNANLSEACLHGARIRDANLRGVELFKANLQAAHLDGSDLQGARLDRADLRGARLVLVNLEGTNLRNADLRDVNLWMAWLPSSANFEGVIWDRGYVSVLERERHYEAAGSSYRDLKIWHQQHGFYEIVGEFHHRELVCGRKQAQQGFLHSLQRQNPLSFLKSLPRASWGSLKNVLRLYFYEQLFGYGERPWRVARAAFLAIAGFTFAYLPYSNLDFSASGVAEFWNRLLPSLYFSAISFTALGYGGWVEHPTNWTRYLGVVESFIGVFLIALFLVTFTRKMTR